MQVKALIFEQLEVDGTLRIFKMMSDSDRPLVVALSDEYDEPRVGPVHFLDAYYESAYDRGFATAKVRRIGPRRFYQTERGIHFDTSWVGIPTQRGWLTCYVLMLPEFAVPISVRLFDPHSDRNYRKTVIRDDLCKRFNLYLACRSSKGRFDFVLQTGFEIDRLRFKDASYSDEYNDESGWRIDYQDWLVSEESEKIHQFFAGRIIMGDMYSTGQAGAVGPGAHARDMTFNQIWNQVEGEIDLPRLSEQLALLRQEMNKAATEPEHDVTVGAIASAGVESIR
jgi:hypothetical protein